MLILHYFNWAGTPEDFKAFASQIRKQAEKAEDINLFGIFIPSSEWHYVAVWNVKTYEKVLEIYKKYSEKFGPLKISLGKEELLHTLEEVSFL